MSQEPQAAYTRQLSLSTALGFSATSLPVSALVIALAVYLPPYYATHIGLGASVGLALMTVRLLDMGVDVALGMAMDRTRTAFGRYRIWMIAGAPILMLAVYMLFINAQPGAGIGYLITWLLVLYLGMSILVLSHSAWAATLATHYHERSRIFAILAAVGVLGSVAVLLIPIFAHAKSKTDFTAIKDMGWFVVLITPLAVGLVTSRTRETITRDVEGPHFQLKDYLSLLARPSLIRLLLADLVLTLGPGWMSAIYLFYFRDSRGFSLGTASILLAVYIAAGFVGAPIVGMVARKFGKHRTLMATTTAYSLGLFAIMAIPKGNFPVAVAPMFWCGFNAAGFALLTRAMLADISDEVRLEQGKERVSLLYALTTFTTKFAGAFSIFLTYSVLGRVGYNMKEGAVNGPAAIHGLEMAYIIGPIFFVMLGGACFIGYRLGPDRHAEIRRQLDERDALYDEAPILQSAGVEAPVIVSADSNLIPES